jgi:hypothetical protein
VLTQPEYSYLLLGTVSTNAVLFALVLRNRIAHRKQLSALQEKCSESDQNRESLSVRLQLKEKELTAAHVLIESRGRFIAKIRPLFRRYAGAAADYQGQNEVLEENLRLLCTELDEEQDSRRQEATAEAALDIAEILVEHA